MSKPAAKSAAKPSVAKKSKDEANQEAYNTIDAADEAKSFLEKIVSDVSKSSATKQIIIGTTSGWVTGFITMKVGKVAACAVGGGIILLQVAVQQGYIDINWDKVKRKAEKLSDKVDEKITGEGPNLMDKVERLVDRSMDKGERLLRQGQERTRRWYHAFIGDDEFQPKDIHYFLLSFAAGLAIGVGTAK